MVKICVNPWLKKKSLARKGKAWLSNKLTYGCLIVTVPP